MILAMVLKVKSEFLRFYKDLLLPDIPEAHAATCTSAIPIIDMFVFPMARERYQRAEGALHSKIT